MAGIENRGHGTYRITVSAGYSPSGKRIVKKRTVRFTDDLTQTEIDKRLAKEIAKFEIEVEQSTCTDGNITLKRFTEEWLEKYAEVSLQETTIINYKAELNNRILPALGHKKINKIKPMDLLTFYNNLLEEGMRLDGKAGHLSDRTIKLQHQILSSMLGTATRWQLIDSNPCANVRPPKREFRKKTIKHLNEKESAIFISIMEKESLNLRSACYLALWGGLRRGEILALTWEDIDFFENTATINKSLTYSPKRGYYIKDTKNRESTRIISLPLGVINVLRLLQAEQEAQKERLANLWHDNGLIFTTWEGRPMALSTPGDGMKKAIIRYNEKVEADSTLTDKEKASLRCPEINFHGLRHTSATLMIHSGTNVRAVSARLGHAETSTTMNIYAHALKTADKEAVEKLESVIPVPETPQLKIVERNLI